MLKLNTCNIHKVNINFFFLLVSQHAIFIYMIFLFQYEFLDIFYHPKREQMSEKCQ